MKRFTELTIKELGMIEVMIANFTDGCGGTTFEDLKADNYSWISVKDFLKSSTFSKHQIAGLLGSLMTKDIISEDDRGGLYCFNEYWFEGKFEDADVLAEYCTGE